MYNYKHRAFMYDLARGMRGDVCFFEELLKRIAKYDYNMLALNIEYRFKFKSNPAIGTADSLTHDNIKYLDSVAKDLGIELVPFMNCAGHCEGIFSLEKYKDLCADPTGIYGTVWQNFSSDAGKAVNAATFASEQILIGNEGAIALMKELFEDLMACFSSKYFHIGFDEVRQMHVQMPDADEDTRFKMVYKHLVEMASFVTGKGKIPIIWGGSSFSRFSKSQDIRNIPKNVIIIDAYYGDLDDTKERMVKTSSVYKNAGLETLLGPAVNGFRGNPVLSCQSTGNIRKLNMAMKEVFDSGTSGIFLCHWETDFGGCFSAHWPWIFYQGQLFKGADLDGMDFLREYTKIEWGLDNDSLEKWYNLIETKINHEMTQSAVNTLFSVEDMEGNPMIISGMLNRFKRSIFRTDNLLRELQDAREWITSSAAAKACGYLQSANQLATDMLQEAERRKEEPESLLIWGKAYEAMFTLMILIDELSMHYGRAAEYQGSRTDEYESCIMKCVDVLTRILEQTEHLKKWADRTVSHENCAEEEKWWIPRAQEDLKKKISALIGTIYNNRSLINFNRFVRFDSDIPNRVFHR